MVTRKICTKENPYKEKSKFPEYWMHPDARETDWDSDYTIEFHCPHCKHTWLGEMPD